MIALFHSRRITTIRKLQELPAQKYDAVFGRSFVEEKAEIKHVLQNLPIFEIKAFVTKVSSGDRECIKDGGSISFNTDSDEVELSIRLLRGNPKMKIHAPKYHKAKVATFWLLVGSGDTLVCCRRVDATHSELKVKLPANRLFNDGCAIHAEILSDSMIGFSFSLSLSLH